MPTNYITEPAGTVDTFTAKGDVILAHDPEVAKGYREAAREAAQRGPGRVIPSSQPAPRAESLPSPGVARQVANREVQRLRAQAEAGRRDLQGRFVWTASGAQVSDPAQLAMRAQLAAEVDAAAAEADRLSGLDDHAAQVWAYGRGVR